jgi:hypothetical protein
VDMLKGWTEGRSSEGDLAALDELSTALRLSSICGLGQVVPVPIQSVLKHFRGVVDDHIVRKQCPAGVCFPAVHFPNLHSTDVHSANGGRRA